MTTSTRPAPRRGPLTIGCLVFSQVDQIDVTGPFEVLARVPNATVRMVGTTAAPVRDVHGLVLTPEVAVADAPPLDVLVVPGGPGQQALMDDAAVVGLIRGQHDAGRLVFSVCTGALLCGAAGILRGRRATTHWAAWDLLPYYGATPTRSRVVVDDHVISCAGVTAGLDGALAVAALLRGDAAAEQIQLDIEYAPEPHSPGGTPDTTRPEVLGACFARYGPIRASREAEALRRHARRVRPTPPAAVGYESTDNTSAMNVRPPHRVRLGSPSTPRGLARRAVVAALAVASTIAMPARTDAQVKPARAEQARAERSADPCPGMVTQADLNACADRRAARAESALRRTYAALLARVDSTRRPALADAQAAWERYREAYCRYRASAAEGGSMQPMLGGFCREEVTLARERQLRRDDRDESR